MVVTGVPVRSGQCGEVVSINCSASVLGSFVTGPVITWQESDGQTVDYDETLDTGLMSSGLYTCLACVTVERVGIEDLCSNITVNISSGGVCVCTVCVCVF